jgi:hypothetical protein
MDNSCLSFLPISLHPTVHFSKHRKTQLLNDADKCNNVIMCMLEMRRHYNPPRLSRGLVQPMKINGRRSSGTRGTYAAAQLWTVADTMAINEDRSHRGSNNVLPHNTPEALPVIQPRLRLTLWIQNTRNEFGSFLERKTASRLSTENTMSLHKALLQNMYYKNCNLRHTHMLVNL